MVIYLEMMGGFLRVFTMGVHLVKLNLVLVLHNFLDDMVNI